MNIYSEGISQAGRSLSEPGRYIAGLGNLNITSKRKITADRYTERAFIRIIYIYIISKLMVFTMRIITYLMTIGFMLLLE